MSYTIDNYEIEEAQYADPENTIAYLYTANAGEVIKDDRWGPNNDGTHWDTFVSLHPSAIFIKPYKEFTYLVWDYTNNVWVIDHTLFTDVLKQALKDHRNTKFQPTVTFNGVTANNTPEERNLINGIISYLQSKGVNLTLSWKQPDDVFAPATIADFQGLVLKGGDITENAFKSEHHVLTLHATTPFMDIPTAIAAFDAYYNSL